MNQLKLIVLLALLVSINFACTKEEIEPPTQEAFKALQDKALKKRTQIYTLNADADCTFTSEKGVNVRIDPASLSINGESLTGEFQLEFVELYNAGDMLVTNKRTMGRMDNGDLAIIITGGAFYINATQDGKQIDYSVDIEMDVPGDLTGGVDTAMILWTGEVVGDGTLTWYPDKGQSRDRTIEHSRIMYFLKIDNFGWTNIDKFAVYEGEKTTLLVEVPEGYNPGNSSIYMKHNEEPNALASLDMFNEETNRFTEHYGQIPVGLKCHIIFVTVRNGKWRYAVHSVEVEKDAVYHIDKSEMKEVKESELVNIIDKLP